MKKVLKLGTSTAEEKAREKLEKNFMRAQKLNEQLKSLIAANKTLEGELAKKTNKKQKYLLLNLVEKVGFKWEYRAYIIGGFIQIMDLINSNSQDKEKKLNELKKIYLAYITDPKNRIQDLDLLKELDENDDNGEK